MSFSTDVSVHDCDYDGQNLLGAFPRIATIEVSSWTTTTKTKALTNSPKVSFCTFTAHRSQFMYTFLVNAVKFDYVHAEHRFLHQECNTQVTSSQLIISSIVVLKLPCSVVMVRQPSQSTQYIWRLELGSGYFWVQSWVISHQLWSYTNTAFPLVAESNIHLMPFQFLTITTPSETKP